MSPSKVLTPIKDSLRLYYTIFEKYIQPTSERTHKLWSKTILETKHSVRLDNSVDSLPHPYKKRITTMCHGPFFIGHFSEAPKHALAN